MPNVKQRHHTVQFSGHDTAVDVPGGDRVRQHDDTQAEREGPGRLHDARRVGAPGRLPRRRRQRHPRPTRWYSSSPTSNNFIIIVWLYFCFLFTSRQLLVRPSDHQGHLVRRLRPSR